MTIRVMMLSNHQILCEGIAAAIGLQLDMVLQGITPERSNNPNWGEPAGYDVVLIRLEPRDADALDWLHQMTLDHPARHIVVFSCDAQMHPVNDVLQAGVMGYIEKSSGMDELMAAIRAAAAGRVYLCPRAAYEMVSQVLKVSPVSSPEKVTLGAREEQVLRLIADGYSSKEIARKLFISPNTVDVHRRNIMRKTGLHKAADLTRYAICKQMVSV